MVAGATAGRAVTRTGAPAQQNRTASSDSKRHQEQHGETTQPVQKQTYQARDLRKRYGVATAKGTKAERTTKTNAERAPRSYGEEKQTNG